jgi:carbamoyl-phosphate synthase large subunit
VEAPATTVTTTIDVLITSASAKIPLIRRMRAALASPPVTGRVWVADLDPDCLARNFADGFWRMAPISELAVEELVDFCTDHGIRLIIPTRDGELRFFARNRAALARAGVHVGIGSVEGVDGCLDKLAFYESCAAAGIPSIPTYATLDELRSAHPRPVRVVVKERYGAGSRTIGLDLDLEDAARHARDLDEPVFQPMTHGVEHSVDLYVNSQGKTVEVVPRIRHLVRHGESVVTETVEAPALVAASVDIAERFELRGHAVLQAFVDHDGRPVFIECNPRVGGASALSMEAGLDTLGWSLTEASGGGVEPRLGVYRRGLKMVRYPSDRFLTT